MRDENLEISQHMEIRLPFMKCFLKEDIETNLNPKPDCTRR